MEYEGCGTQGGQREVEEESALKVAKNYIERRESVSEEAHCHEVIVFLALIPGSTSSGHGG